MLTQALIIATFTSPQHIGSGPASLLWLLPLVTAIAIVHKATKLPEIKAANFIKETAGLFASIVVFIAVTAVILYVVTWIAT